MASGYSNETSPSQWIRMRLAYSTSETDNGHNVYVELQLRRINTYGDVTHHFPSTSYITINGNKHEWQWTQAQYPEIPAYNNDWHVFAARTVEVAHTGATTIGISGGNDMGPYLTGSASTDVALEARISAPTNISGTNLESDGTDGKAYSRINVGGWGLNSNSGRWIVSKTNSRGSEWTSSDTDNTMFWNGLASSTSTISCAITTWYPEALNDNGLWTFGNVKYIASPSAPRTTITGSSSHPQIKVSGSVTYKGGETNSATCNTTTIKNWSLHYRKTGTSSYTQWRRNTTTDVSHPFDAIPASSLESGYNYDIATRALNKFGAYGTTYETIYCPSGINGRVTSDLTGAMTIAGSYTYSGGLSVTTKDKMAYYTVKWSTNKSTVDGGGGTETSSFATDASVTVTGLTPGTTYYYRVYGWNIYGLSQSSTTLSYTTKNRYEPTLYAPTFSATGMGANISVTVKTTGGLSENESTVKTLKLYGRPANGTWEQIGEDATELNLQAEQSYTFANAITGARPLAGDWEFRVWVSNGEDVQFSPSSVLSAPYDISLQATASVTGSPVQISLQASATSDTQVYQWRLGYRKSGETTYTFIDTLTDETNLILSTHNHLDYATNYDFVAQVYDECGLWRQIQSPLTLKTPNRFSWSYVSGETQKAMTPSFKTSTKNSSIIDVYYIVKNSLGSVEIDQDLRNKRLRFITQTLNYRPENVASILFTNGKILAYALDGDVYKFGIWEDGAIEETFHNGYAWETTSYKIPDTDGYTVESIQSVSGLNSSSAFSTTACEDVKLWETD